MSEKVALSPADKPEGYSPPSYDHVKAIASLLRRQRQNTVDKMWARKRARRGQWDDVVRHIPSAFRKLLLEPDLPQINDMINRVAGLIAKEPPTAQVLPPSGHDSDVRKAAKEEKSLNAVREQIADQQDRDPYAMGIDSQVSLGESWIGVFPDAKRMSDSRFLRGREEAPKDYMERYKEVMADCGIPIRMIDFDPQTVLPFKGENEQFNIIIIESDHEMLDIELGYGYKRVKGAEGETADWLKLGHSLSEPYVGSDVRDGETAGVVDTNHDRSRYGSSPNIERVVRKVMYFDRWTYQCYLDGLLVEQWEHDFGICPIFPAGGEQSSDRDPEWQNQSIIDPALAIARQVVYFSAVLAANSMQHGFPTPFLKNPQSGLIGLDGKPLTRAIRLGEMNLLGPNEEIVFPYLNAQMMPDFFKYMEYLSGTLEASTLSNFGNALGTEMAGYAIAQIRAQQMSVLAPVYRNAERQWRKIYYFIRYLVKNEFPAGIYLRGAIEESESGAQYRPLLEYDKKRATDFAIDVSISEGIKQDEIAERKSAIEMGQAGYWSARRVMEHTGVEDPHAELTEIKMHRMTNSPAYDQLVLTLAQQLATERAIAVQSQEQNTPFMHALNKAKETYMGGGGQFQNQGATPVNADTAGTPLAQQTDVRTQQPGGPTQGVGDFSQFGVPELPGGVEGVRQTPAGVM